jgi:hypothetical protein
VNLFVDAPVKGAAVFGYFWGSFYLELVDEVVLLTELYFIEIGEENLFMGVFELGLGLAVPSRKDSDCLGILFHKL